MDGGLTNLLQVGLYCGYSHPQGIAHQSSYLIRHNLSLRTPQLILRQRQTVPIPPYVQLHHDYYTFINFSVIHHCVNCVSLSFYDLFLHVDTFIFILLAPVGAAAPISLCFFFGSNSPLFSVCFRLNHVNFCLKEEGCIQRLNMKAVMAAAAYAATTLRVSLLFLFIFSSSSS